MTENAKDVTDRELQRAREEGMVLERIANLSILVKDMSHNVNAQIEGIKDILRPVQMLAQQAADKSEANKEALVIVAKDIKDLQELPTTVKQLRKELDDKERRIDVLEKAMWVASGAILILGGIVGWFVPQVIGVVQ